MTRAGRGIDWAGIAAVILALGVVAAVILGEVFAGLNPSRVVSIEEVASVATVLGAAVGALGGYLAGKRRYLPPRNGPPAPPGSSDGGDGEPPGMSGPGGKDAA